MSKDYEKLYRDIKSGEISLKYSIYSGKNGNYYWNVRTSESNDIIMSSNEPSGFKSREQAYYNMLIFSDLSFHDEEFGKEAGEE